MSDSRMHPRLTSSASMRVGSYGPASAMSRSVAPPQVINVAALFDRWNRSLDTLDPDQVVNNYAHDAVLLPTVADEPHVGHSAIRKYFVHFLEGKPRGQIVQRHVQVGWDMAVDMGTYLFNLEDGQKVTARYTFVYRPYAGQWLIAHHHSSVLPEQFCKL